MNRLGCIFVGVGAGSDNPLPPLDRTGPTQLPTDRPATGEPKLLSLKISKKRFCVATRKTLPKRCPVRKVVLKLSDVEQLQLTLCKRKKSKVASASTCHCCCKECSNIAKPSSSGCDCKAIAWSRCLSFTRPKGSPLAVHRTSKLSVYGYSNKTTGRKEVALCSVDRST